MLPSIDALRSLLHVAIAEKAEQGCVTDGLDAELNRLPDSYDALLAFAARLAGLPLRRDWPYAEPETLDAILAECDPDRPVGALGPPDVADLERRARAAFLGRVCGCMLGKPFEFDPTLDEIRAALEPLGEWPLSDYLSERVVPRLRERQPQMPELVRERITHVAPDDDINYTIIGMLLLEEHGADFTREHLREQWLLQLPVRATFGPERTALIGAGVASLGSGPDDGAPWRDALNPGEELCGALIRVDAYGYACFGHPARAAALAFRDASFTHRRTGVYASMFVAAAIAAMPYVSETLDAFEIALRFVPRRSRFAETARLCLDEVAAAASWEQGYERVHVLFGRYGHCRIYQEIGTLMNTLRFARSTGEGICLQVMQGNDTDSFGATAGSLLGARFGDIEERWLLPFRDDLQTALAMFHERSLARVAERMGALVRRMAP